MKCPVCPDSTLAMTDRQGIEIDYCPTCRGVWLDRGELDKLVQIGARQDAAPVQAAPQYPPQQPQYPSQPRRPDFHDSDFGKKGYGGHRRKSWLSDIFD